MNRFSEVLHSRVALAIIGAILLAGIGAGVAILPTLYSSDGGNFTSQTALAANQNSSSTPSSTSASNVGTVVNLRGTIQSIASDGGSFVLSLSDGSSRTVVITAQTQLGGDDGARAGLQVGMSVRVRGTVQSDGTVSAQSIRLADS